MIGEECQYICSNEGASGQQPMATVDPMAAAPEPQAAHSGPSGQQPMATDDPVAAAEIGLRSMATVDQVRAAEEKASEIEANAAIAYYAPGAGGVGAPGDA